MYLLDSKIRNEPKGHKEINDWATRKISLPTTRSYRPALGHEIFEVAVYYTALGHCCSCLSVAEILVESQSTKKDSRCDNNSPSPSLSIDFQT